MNRTNGPNIAAVGIVEVVFREALHMFRKSKWRPPAMVLLATTMALGSAAASEDAIAEGSQLVQKYCTDCHATRKTGDSPYSTAPRFRDLHLRYDVEDLSEALVEGIVTAHAEMPQFEFEPDEAAAIVAYLKSLETVSHQGAPDNPQGNSK